MNRNLYLICSFLCFLFIGETAAQDTIKVQTLTWDSTSRSGYFQFPDDPGQTYRKILMRYNMRCHDAAVGNGNVGCREWDYSCNTFITDPNQQDSTRATHPSHIISNFSGTDFDYVTYPTYTYLQFMQHSTNYLEVIGETTATVGAGAGTMVLDNYESLGRHQFLYTADELSTAGLSAGAISGLRFNLTLAGGEVSYLRIRMKATSKTELDPNNPDLDGFTEVYFLNTPFLIAGAQTLNFYQNFDWDGSSNVLVDYSFTNQLPFISSTILADDAGFPAGLLNSTADNALDFEGAGALDLSNAANLSSISNEITVSMWCYGNAAVLPINSSIFEATDADNNRQLNVHLPWSNATVYWDCGNDGTGYDRIEKAATAQSFEGQWNHWTFTKNATTGTMRIYLNGTLWHSGTGKTRSIDIQNFNFGGAVNGSNPYYGLVDEIRVWNVELDEATIQDWLFREVSDQHPFYGNLVAYHKLDEGIGTIALDNGPGSVPAPIYGFPSWRLNRGKDLYKNFEATNMRPQFTFVQGEYILDDQIIIVTDSIPNNPNSVISYAVDGSDLVIVDTVFLYQAGDLPVVDENGTVTGTVYVAPEGTINIGDLTYYQKADAKFEILSLVTPYGNGLDLGQQGATFFFDLTDFAPILKGEKFMSMELGGQNQEDMDIQFWFIEGTPERDVLQIQNIWPFRRGYYDQIQNDQFFEPRDVSLRADGSKFKIRSSITGHGQNGEFVPRAHYINLDGGTQEFVFDVWKQCSENPMYPQGGTWTFARAGWCPGLDTDIHESDLTFLVNAGESVNIDYGVNGSFLTEANYLVSSQLVTYGPLNHQTDASIEAIIRPTDMHQYGRYNPACNLPRIVVKNGGSNTIGTLKIQYRVEGGGTRVYDYSEPIYEGETREIDLPVDATGFWNTASDTKIFEVQLLEVNGAADENPDNNMMRSSFEVPEMFDIDETIILKFKTNNRASENFWTIRDETGTTVLSRTGMANATTYEDEVVLPDGCYSLYVDDSGDDGLSYWYWDVVDPSVGSGYFKFQYYFNNFAVSLKTFESEFGGSVRFDFVVGQYTDTKEVITEPRLFSVYPNPASDHLTVEIQGYEADNFQVDIIDPTGKILQTQTVVPNSTDGLIYQLSLEGLAPGMYYTRVRHASKTWSRPFVKM
ncbi:MAG: T9SS type A sorting domain-containing protein [Saprospiraceae bacterium]|nr:T9SS type A sorting domain-containing protein [Saprospiraceae bacterium]